ncbi:hypothetical protein V2I01_16080 [Micromonospora sp. BRA006-A]|nr:hypothetical protein [Micromonospora sp. BRA006-A]
MTGWEPATEAEVAMRDALRAQDQQQYFRVLTRVDLLLPIASGPSAGWGTWTAGGRTHVLAFTSVAALRASLGRTRVPPAASPTRIWQPAGPTPSGGWRSIPACRSRATCPPGTWLSSPGRRPAPRPHHGARARLERVENATRGARNTVPRPRPPPAVPVPPAAVRPRPCPIPSSRRPLFRHRPCRRPRCRLRPCRRWPVRRAGTSG